MRIILLSIFIVVLSSCSYKEFNDKVASQNAAMFAAYGDALSKQTCEGGRIAVSLMYGLGVGRQKLKEPETVKDYVKVFSYAINPWIPFITHGRHDESQAVSAGRDVYMYSSRQDSLTQTRSNYVENFGSDNPTSYGTTEDYSTESQEDMASIEGD